MSTAYISLGSNQGDSVANLAKAQAALALCAELTIVKTSKIYLTEPQLKRDQAWFANQVMALETSLPPEPLLIKLLELELSLGRVRAERYGPRVIDLDLLLYDQEILATAFLTLPHPSLAERAFVLVPLLEITPNLSLPDQTSLKSLLDKLKFKQEGNKIYQS